MLQIVNFRKAASAIKLNGTGKFAISDNPALLISIF